MEDEAGMGHVRLKPVHSYLPYVHLVGQLDPLLGDSLCDLPALRTSRLSGPPRIGSITASHRTRGPGRTRP